MMEILVRKAKKNPPEGRACLDGLWTYRVRITIDAGQPPRKGKSATSAMHAKPKPPKRQPGSSSKARP